MRSVLFAFALVACSSTPSPAPIDAGPDTSPDLCACTDTQPLDIQPVDTAPEVGPEAPGADAPVPEDRAPPEDRPAPADVAPDAPRCPTGPSGDCFGSSVNLQVGIRQPDGTTLHCGRCGNTCAAGSFCLNCACER